MEVINTKMIEINNRFLSIKFSKNGAILNIQHKKLDENIRFHTNIISYGTSKQSDHHSGAYLFIPDGNGQDITMSNYDFLRIQRGPLINRIDLIHELFGLRYELTNTNG
jgi:alpha-mannosidase II